jgi:CRP/FNR family cyclic AMP-dependent transcriptional regulator
VDSMGMTDGNPRIAPAAALPQPLQEFTDLEKVESFAPESYLFIEGDASRGVFLIHSGTVNLMIAGKDGANKMLHSAGPGTVLGLSSAVSGQPHETTAQALEPTRVGFIDREAFLTALRRSPEAWFAVLEMLSNDINTCYDLMRMCAAEKR